MQIVSGESTRVATGHNMEKMKKSGSTEGRSASELIDKRIAELGDWRRETLSRMRKLIKEADPDVVEEWKWRGTPVWSHDGIICTGESYKTIVKLTFAKGASLKDPAKLFNSSLDGNVRPDACAASVAAFSSSSIQNRPRLVASNTPPFRSSAVRTLCHSGSFIQRQKVSRT